MGTMMRTRIYMGFFALAVAASGAARADVDEDFAFASGLVNFEPSFPEFAQRVVEAVLASDPSQKDRSKIIQAEIFIKRRMFAEAEALIAELGNSNPKAQAISLSLGKNYFAIGEFDKSRALFDDFFKLYENGKPTDKDVALRYRDAAFQYAQMKEMVGDYEAAAASYKRVEDVAETPEMQRSMMVSRAKALVQAAEKKSGSDKDKLLEEAIKICETIQWGGLDLQFVDSIVIMANVELARGKPDAARKVLMSHMDIIKPIDETMKQLGMPLRDSPMGGARSLLGRLLKEDAARLASENKTDEAIAAYSGALLEYYNVFIKYGDSPWGPSAGLEAKEIKSTLETKFNKVVKIDLPDTLAKKAAGTEFMMADNLFRQKKYSEAVGEYLKVLAQFPEAGELSMGALGNLLQCYMYLDDSLYAKLVANYLGERFSGSKSSIPAKGLSSVAQLYNKAGNAEMSQYMFDVYLKYCPNDSQAGKILFYLAGLAEKAQNQALADKYYARLITDYQNDQNYTKALSRRAWKAYLDKDYAGALEGMRHYIEETKGQPSPTLVQAMFALGDSYQRTGDLPNAVRQYSALIAAITPDNNPYGRTQEEKDKNAKVLEQARFSLAYCLSRLPSDPARKAAVAKLDEFLGFHPQSGLAPKALNVKGSLQMALKDPAANQTFERLAREFPNTDEGKNAQYARINGALELNQIDQAREAFGAMISSPGSYSIGEFARVGQAMLDKQQWKEAGQAFAQVVGKTEDRVLLERALYGIGAAQYETGDYVKAVESLNDLMTRWPTSAMFYPAKFKLASANLKLNQISAAKIALNDIFRMARDAEILNDATMLYADILKSENDKVGALASYKRMELLNSGNMKSEKERAQIAQAIQSAIDLALEIGNAAEALDSADRFLQLFPTHPNVAAVRQKRIEANQKLAMEASSSAAAPQP